MEEKALFKYIKKLIPFILIICLLASVLVNLGLRNQRKYSASAVINYDFSNAESGETPSGEPLDVNEIKSSAIMSKVMDKLDLHGSYSVDNLTSRITITACPDEDKEAQKQANLDEGIEYVYVPTKYIVAFNATNSEGEAFARTLLDEVLDTYFSVFAEKYINEDHISNDLDKIYNDNYDYIEMVEYIDSKIADTVTALYKKNSASPYYRSTETEKSFEDLVNEFNYFDSVKLSDLFAKIYKYQVTKDKALLISDYKTRIEKNNISSENEKALLADVEEVINAYVDKMRDSGNTNITYEYILDDLYERSLTDANGNTLYGGDQTVTYDELIYLWRDHNRNDKIDVIDSAYCQYVIDTFSECTGACKDKECEKSAKSCTELNNADYAAIEKEISEGINELVDALGELYNDTLKVNSEYNEYMGCKNISVLSTVATTASVDVTTYSVIAFVFFMVICCGGAILVGRMNDIITATFYTDPKTGFRNRAYFDKYLKKYGKYKLDDGTVVVSLAIANQKEINDTHGREVGDAVIKLIADELRNSFARMNAEFIYNGNSHYIVIVNKSDAITAEDALDLFRTYIDERVSLNDVTIKYRAGLAETFREKIRSARPLLVKAINNYKDYVSEAKNN